MKLESIIKDLNLSVLTKEANFSTIHITLGYVSDMLSCVMTGAKHHSVWITLQAHSNIVAVARLLDISAVIITEGASPDDATIKRANDENIVLLSTAENSFNIVGKLWEMGIRDK